MPELKTRSDVVSYNSWLREQNQRSSDTLLQVMENLQVELQGLESALQSEITMEPSRVSRVIVAMETLLTEIHLLAILKGRI